jgi:hypothetical protein
MGDREFSDFQIFQHSGKGIPLFMTGHKNCLQADYLLGPGPCLIKNNLPGRGLTEVEKHCSNVVCDGFMLLLSLPLIPNKGSHSPPV